MLRKKRSPNKIQLDPNIRFFNLIKLSGEDECWEWQANKSRLGYGSFSFNGKFIQAHRYAFKLFNPNIDMTGLEVMHTCDTPGCVNPKHLKLGTHADNMKDMVNKGRLPDKHGENHPSNKLDETDVKQIRYLMDNKIMSSRAIGKVFNIDKTQVLRIYHRKSWAHIQ